MGRAAVAAAEASGYFAAMYKERIGLEVTRRALVLGAAAALFLNLACPYTVLVLQNAGLTSDYLAARRDDGLLAAGGLGQSPVKDRV